MCLWNLEDTTILRLYQTLIWKEKLTMKELPAKKRGRELKEHGFRRRSLATTKQKALLKKKS